MANKIKIFGDASKGCIFFEGSTVDPKFLGTIFADFHPSISDRIVIKRNDRLVRGGQEFRQLFRKLNPVRVQNQAGENLVADLGYTTTQVIEYINEQATVTDTPVGGFIFAGTQSLDFTRDETDTSILFSNGDHHGINSVKAIAKDNGKVGILGMRGDFEFYELEFTSCTINGSSAGNTIETVVNNLNALFTVTALTAPTPAPIYTQLEGVDTSWESSETINPVGDGLHGKGDSGTSYHGPRVWTTDTIDEPGEYFTFEAKNVVAGGGPLLGIGLYSVANGDLTEIEDDNLSNSGHHGFFFSNWLYNYSGYTAPWTTYGSASGLSYGPGWSFTGNAPMFRYSDANTIFRAGEGDVDGNVLFKCGITDSGFVGVWYYDIESEAVDGLYGARTNDWVLLCRSSTPVPAGQYGLMVKIPSTSGQITSVPRRFATDPDAPTLFYRYIESPDGVFQYPLFSSEEEANYIDGQNGGAGTSSQIVFPDESTQTAWYKPDTGYTDDGTVAPSDTADITWTEILSLTDAAMAPSAYFNPFVSSFTEGTTINIQLAPQDVSYTTTTTGAGAIGLTTDATGLLQGNLPYVTEDTIYTINVIRTNSYGSSTGQFQLEVLDNPAASEISGWSIIQGNTQAPNVVLRSENAVLEHNLTLSPGQEASWPHQNYSTMGFLSAVGESVKTTNNIAAETNAWEVQFTPWSNGNLNHLSYYGVGWDNNSSQGIAGTWVGGTWKMVYEIGGDIVVYFDDVEYLRSATTYSGAKTLVYATHNSYSVDTVVPTVTIVDSAFVGNPPTGFTQEHGSMDDSTTLSNEGVVTLDATLPVGKRMLVNKSWVEANVLPLVPDALNKAYIGVPATDAAWGSIDLHLDFDAVMRWEGQNSSVAHKTTLADGSDTVARHESSVGSTTDAYYHYAIEWNGTDLIVLADPDLSKFSTEHDKYEFARYSCYENYTDQSGALPLVMACKGGGNVTLSMSGISFIDVPDAPVDLLTPWSTALDFSGSAERTMMVTGGDDRNPLRQNGAGVTAATSGQVSSDNNARPWAVSCVFRVDGNSSNQVIWSQSEGANSTDDSIMLTCDASRGIHFQWGRDGALNNADLFTAQANKWYGLYVEYDGFRSGTPTAAEMTGAFRFYLVDLEDGSLTQYAGNTNAWSSVARMTRTLQGDFFIGGRDANRSFHGQVSALTVTTLRQGSTLPSDAEISMMVRDPKQWMLDYKVGQSYRQPSATNDYANFQMGNILAAMSTQMWLMGDGPYDSYSNMIRNHVSVFDQNITKLNMISMASNDIQTVNIPGLTS